MADPATIDPARLADSFLAEIPVEQLAPVLTSIGVGTWEVIEVDAPVPNGLIARIEGPGPPLIVSLTVDEAGRID